MSSVLFTALVFSIFGLAVVSAAYGSVGVNANAGNGVGVETGAQGGAGVNSSVNSNNSNGLKIGQRLQAGNFEVDGKEIRVEAKSQNRVKLNVGNVSAETELNLTEETTENKTKIHAMLSNGKNAEIKVMPDVASETALAQLRLHVCSEDNNCTIVLKEVGNTNLTIKAAYEIQVERHYKLLALFQAKAENKVQVNAETGDVISVGKPWWAFLAVESDS